MAGAEESPPAEKILEYESSRICKKTLRKLQDHSAQGRHPCDLH
jgi:hypothetical protein